jgi:hypothetical protein
MTADDWSLPQKRVAGLIGLVTAAALLLQTWLTVTSVMANGHTLGFALFRVTGYFTLWTNALVAVVCAMIATGRLRRTTGSGALVSGGTAYAIAMVGIIYHLLLGGLRDLSGLWLFSDHMVHSVTPTLMTGFWLWAGATNAISWRAGLLWLVWPMAYTIQALARGVATGWYPYFFLDVGTYGWGMTLAHVVGLLVVFAVAALAFVALGRLRRTSVPA